MGPWGREGVLLSVSLAMIGAGLGCGGASDEAVGGGDPQTPPASAIAGNGGTGTPATIQMSGDMGLSANPDTPAQSADLGQGELTAGPTEQLPPAAGGDPAAPTADGATIPCAVAQAAHSNCGTCHGAQPMGGAIKLTEHAHWHAMSPVYDPTKKVYEVAQVRIGNGEMPQSGALSEPDKVTLDTWLTNGAPAGTAEDANCELAPLTPANTRPKTNGNYGRECDKEGAFDPLTAREGEMCWDFPVHDGSFNGKFSVPTNESYHEWYYDVPWPAGHVATRFGADFDNLEVLHHYLTFASGAARRHGDLDRNVTGTTLGSNAKLISGWAVGGCTQNFPENVGLEMPTSSSKIMIQWHMYNNTGRPQDDGSLVQLCTVPSTDREHTAGITFLGTENFNSIIGMPVGESDWTTTCTNNSGGPITIVGYNPHMHLLGANMKTDLVKADGTKQTLFDEPFKFDYQIAYDNYAPLPVVMPGEKLETTCSFFNDTGANVAFGQSTTQEMCYQFVVTYPVGALDNGVISLIGATNTCW